MDENIRAHLELLVTRYPALEVCKEDIATAYEVLAECYAHGGKLLVAGNGGSAADAEHIVGELMKGFMKSRKVDAVFAKKLREIDPERGSKLAKNLERSLMAIPLVAHEALTTAYINDVGSLGIFAQQLFGYGRPGDVFLGISTSGNSENILNAAIVAKALGIHVIGLTGASGGKLARLAELTVRVPETVTYKVQELHLPVYHSLCIMLEEKFFGGVEDGIF